jgi:Ca2+-transporting ATPase
MIYILFAATVISIFLKEYTDSAIILIVVLLNGIIGYIQESNAERAIEALKKLTSPKALVRRDGSLKEIDAGGLVVGDIVVLEAGRFIPADLRLIESVNLKLEESALTGESLPVEKDSGFVATGDMPLGDRINMAYMTTNVTYGRGTGVVIATGMDTEIGKIAAILEDTVDSLTPLQRRLADLGRMLGILAVILCTVLFVFAILRGLRVFDMLLTAISLAVAAIPEGLPAVVTIVLAIGVQRMVKQRSIVRRLPAVETLGSVNVVCTDKTGTLTQNRMTVTNIFYDNKLISLDKAGEIESKTGEFFFKGFVLCNDASIETDEKLGDPTETALLDMSYKFGHIKTRLEEIHPRINELPFESDRKMMTTVHEWQSKKLSFTKGALDVILMRTKYIYESGTIRPIEPKDIELINSAASEMASKALRVLALCCRESEGEAIEEELVFVGLAGMIDPPREEAKEAVEVCRKAGITTVMITGDHKDTAFAIAKELNIAKDASQVISGEELNHLTQEELNKRVDKLRVFARVSPEHKVMIVRAFKANGNIVSMTGDGVNDAPSLKAADIGVAMGITGTDVAKGAADMILTDDNFATIKGAIEEGRNIYNNIRKATIYLLSSNLGEIITMFVAVIAMMPVPLAPIHILWVNLVTDSLPGLALGVDPGKKNIMKEKPRKPNESLFAHGGIANLIVYGIIIGGATLLGFSIGYSHGFNIGFTEGGNVLAQSVGIKYGQTFALAILALSQLFHAIGMRDTSKSIFRMNHLNNNMMLVAFFGGLLLQVAIVQLPLLNFFFRTTPLSITQWLVVLGLSVLPLVAHEIIVVVRRITKFADQ